MKPLGFLLILISILLYRAGFRGRALADLPGDTADGMKALVKGDTTTVFEVFQRAGTLSIKGDAAPISKTLGGSGGDLKLLGEMKQLGSKAQGYRLGSTGPIYYDCSGLVFKAMQNIGLYNGLRFQTATFTTLARNVIRETGTPTAGAIVLWRTLTEGHMGVMTDATNCYSARSRKSGIGTSPVSVFTKLYGKPRYFTTTSPKPAVTGKGAGGW